MRRTGPWWRRGWAVLLASLALIIGPANAGNGKGSGKEEGGINPSSIVVVDDDLAMAMPESDDGLGYVEPDGLDCGEDADRMQAAVAHETATGAGVLVAVLDGGFNVNHPEIAANVVPFGYDAIDLDGDPNDPGNGWDDDGDGRTDGGLGHGTFVAGMVLRAAPDARILAVRVRDDEGFGTNEELIRGIEYAVAAGADVINLSLDGAGAKKRAIYKTLTDAWYSGVVLVISAGNDGEASLPSLATQINDTLVVGAVDAFDRVAPFSNYALYDPRPALMIYAPGVDLNGPLGWPCEDTMGRGSGTSFSAGFISGAAALVLERHPEFGPAGVRLALERSVEPVTLADGTPAPYGGRINLAMAVTR